MNSIQLILILLTRFLSSNSHAMTLIDAIEKAEKTSPSLKSIQYREQAAKEQIRTARSTYLPNLDAAVIASNGNVGSPSLFGVDSNLSATERSGVGGALILTQTIWDFGRTDSAVDTAKLGADLSAQYLGVAQSNLDIQVLQSYLECSFLKSEVTDARFTSEQAKIIAKETNRFVVSGQRSVVERYLVDQQAAESDRYTEEYMAKLGEVEKRLAIELGVTDLESIHCEDLNSKAVDISPLLKSNAQNPMLQMSQTQAKVAQSKLNQAKAQENPALIGTVNGGYFKDNALNRPWNYSAGAGIVFPIFTGFRNDSEIGRTAAEAIAQENELAFTQQNVNDANSRFKEQIKATDVALQSLAKEGTLAETAFDLAKKRYFSLQGSMVDLREALRNLDHVRSLTNEARRDFLIAQGSVALFNGARP